jgi:hypothetical protein
LLRKENSFRSSYFWHLEFARTLVLDLGLGEGLRAGGNQFAQNLFLALDGGGSHDKKSEGSGKAGKGVSRDVGELINLGICHVFGKAKAPSARGSPPLSTHFVSFLARNRGMEEPTSPTAPLAAFPPQPEEHRSRAPEFYGFVAWSSTYLLFLLFILWGFLPDEWIVWSGVTWYPNRYFRPTPPSRVHPI